MIAPGAAQAVTGHSAGSLHAPGLSRIRLGVARYVLRIWAGLAGVVLILAGLTVLGQDWALGMFDQGWLSRPLAVCCFAGALIWPLLLVDAWRIGQAPELTARARRRLALTTAVLLVIACAGPFSLGRHLWGAADPSTADPAAVVVDQQESPTEVTDHPSTRPAATEQSGRTTAGTTESSGAAATSDTAGTNADTSADVDTGTDSDAAGGSSATGVDQGTTETRSTLARHTGSATVDPNL